MLLLLYLVHDGPIFEADAAQIKFAIVHGRVDFRAGVFGHIELTLMSSSHVLSVSLELLDGDVTFLDCIVYVVVHVRQVPLQLLCVTIMLYAQGFNLFSLQLLQSLVLISLYCLFIKDVL